MLEIPGQQRIDHNYMPGPLEAPVSLLLTPPKGSGGNIRQLVVGGRTKLQGIASEVAAAMIADGQLGPNANEEAMHDLADRAAMMAFHIISATGHLEARLQQQKQQAQNPNGKSDGNRR